MGSGLVDDVFQLRAGLEAHILGGRNIDLGAGGGIAPLGRRALLDGESAEAWMLPTSQFADLLPKEIERYKKAAKLAGVAGAKASDAS